MEKRTTAIHGAINRILCLNSYLTKQKAIIDLVTSHPTKDEIRLKGSIQSLLEEIMAAMLIPEIAAMIPKPGESSPHPSSVESTPPHSPLS